MRRPLDVPQLLTVEQLWELLSQEPHLSDGDRSGDRFRGIQRERRQDATALSRWADDGGAS